MFTILGTWSQSYEIQYDLCEKNKSAHLRGKGSSFFCHRFLVLVLFFDLSGNCKQKSLFFYGLSFLISILLNAFMKYFVIFIIGRPWLCLLRKFACIRGLGHRCRSELRMPCLLASWNGQRWIHHGFPIAVQQTYSRKKNN